MVTEECKTRAPFPLPPAGGAATPRKSCSENYIPFALFVYTGKVLNTAEFHWHLPSERKVKNVFLLHFYEAADKRAPAVS